MVNYQALSRFTGSDILSFQIILHNKKGSLFESLMKIYCWEMSLIFEYLVISVKTTVNFHNFGQEKC